MRKTQRHFFYSAYQTNCKFVQRLLMAEKKITNDLDVNYRLIGVAASLKEYKLCYHLNQFLNADFKKLNDLTFPSSDRTRTIQFAVFKSGDEEDRNQFFVFVNKNLGEALLFEAGNFDYLMQIKGECGDEEMTGIVSGIKMFPDVIACTEISLRKIKNKERLIYFEEKASTKPVKKFK